MQKISIGTGKMPNSAQNYQSDAAAPSRTRSQPPAWDRLTDESTKAFQAFAAYRDLPADERSLSAVSEQLGKSKSLLARWSTQFRWVERTRAWDSHQDQQRRKRAASDREKMLDRQLQQNRIASQALMAPLLALAKLSQTKADAFAGASAVELTKAATFAAKALPRLHDDERRLTNIADKDNKPEPLTIVGAEFAWVQSACECGHGWDSHDQLAVENGSSAMPCMVSHCGCKHFADPQTAAE
jgi:hypothetical protein